ncbi:MAG TPA: ABC transporter substrate-binding protein [Candidatus Lustribacter sp.]|jgi:NitT/TauT family transport system substrate-binding protein|nr:ABC transporter substrate-binding protein [Candidatus Lustribacter sp.]
MRRRDALAGVAGSLALAVPFAASAQTEAPIRIAGSLTEPYMLPYYGVDIGTFARAGLNVEITTQPTVASVVEAVASNNADVGQGDVIQLANAITRGNLPLAIFAGGGIYSRLGKSLGLAVAQGSSYRSARDLEGQTVGVITLNSLMAIGVQAWLRQNGADLGKIKLIEMLFPQMPPAIAKGLVAAAFMGEPFLSFSGVDLRVLARPYDAIANEFYFGCWFANRDWLSRNAATARKFSGTLYDTARWCNAHAKETTAMLAGHAKLDLSWLQKTDRIPFATSLDTRLMNPVLQQAFSYKVLPKAVAASDLIAPL